MESLYLAIPLASLLGAIIAGFFGGQIGRKGAHTVTILGVGISFILSLVALNHHVFNDGETDFYECFNNDHQVTDHFHEFAMGLQADADGNLYYAKSARHARDSLVPQHGTLLRVSADGSQTCFHRSHLLWKHVWPMASEQRTVFV